MMSRNTSGLIPEGGVIGKLPFDGQWLTERSPTRRVSSHGTHLFATTYAFDFVAVDDDGLTAPVRSMRALFTPEPSEFFHVFGRPLYLPVAGTVVSIRDDEPDHVAHRSVLTRIPYRLNQPQRIRQGLPATPGDHIIIQAAERPHCVGLVHLQWGPVQVSPSDRVGASGQIGRCGNSGNFTQLRLYIQATDNPDLRVVEGTLLCPEESQQHSPQQGVFWTLQRQSRLEQDLIIARP